MARRYSFAGRTAIITGAASGIGRALAIELARRGCNLCLTDVNPAGLAETAAHAGAGSVVISTHVLDVSDAAAVAAFPSQAQAVHARIDVLFNNAGVALSGTFEELTEADFEWLININFWGVVRMTRAFLPVLRRSDDAAIVNLSSVFGLIAPAGQTAYCASKFAVRGFSNALRHELTGSNVAVTVVHPGGVATAIVDGNRYAAHCSAEEARERRERAKQMLRMPPSRAAEIILDGVERRKGRVLVGSDAKGLALLERLMPVSYWTMRWRWLGRRPPPVVPATGRDSANLAAKSD